MKNRILGLCVITLGASTLLAQSQRILDFARSGAIDVRPGLTQTSDPRLANLPAGPGSVPSGSEIERLMREDASFARGLKLFDRAFHRSSGVGAPEMNADSCRACHRDPVIGGAGALELNVSRFGDDGGGTYPFRDLPGGQGLSKMRPPWVDGREETNPRTASVFEQRQTPSILGDGRIDEIPGDVIQANEDPLDLNGDGIFGIARLIDIGGVLEVGRFGWKAQVPRLRDFVMDAAGGELGMTTPDDGRGFALLSDPDPVADPEFRLDEVDDMAHFLSRLPAPERRPAKRPDLVAHGEELFSSIGCALCHIPSLDSPWGPVALYSNLLLHNVMPADFRGMAEPGADVGFFRTPPLWGIVDTAPYMHDGRASTLRAAIDAHDGEAAGVRTEFENLMPAAQEALIFFLKHL